jgi:hypothetical protein
MKSRLLSKIISSRPSAYLSAEFDLAEDGGWGFEAGEFFEEVVGEFEGCRSDVFFDVGDRGCAGDGEHDAGAREEPCEGYLHGCGVELAGDAIEEFMSLPILSERSPGYEGDTVLLAVVEEVVPLAVGKAVAVLDRDDGDDFAGALEVFEGDVGEGDVLDFALGAEAGEAFHGSVEGDGGVGNVELVDGDAVEAEALEASFHGFLQVIWRCVVNPLAGADTLPSALGGDDEVVRVGMEGFSDELFGDVGAVGVGGIDEVDAEFDGSAEGGNGGIAVDWWSPDAFAGDAHSSVGEAVDGEVAERDVSGGGSGEGVRGCGHKGGTPCITRMWGGGLG